MEDDGGRVKRFKHQSYNQALKEVHLPSSFNQTHYETEIGDNESHFHEALQHWRQLNLAPSFIRFANKADALSASMPLLLHNWKEITDMWIVEFEQADDEGLRALLDLLQKMTHDLRATLSPIYTDLLRRLLKLLPKSISASALTVLLETFSVLFKFLLVPSIHLGLLEATWPLIRNVLPKCVPEIQRAVAEVWGSIIRRLKLAAREKAVRLVAETANGLEDASSWIFVLACQSVSQTLHTTTPTIVAPLLLYHLKTQNPDATYVILRRTITALIHHVAKSEQFSVLGEVLVQEFISTLKKVNTSSPESLEELRRMLEVIAILCSVRKGSRLTVSQRAQLFSEFDALPLESISLHPALLKYTIGMLTAGDMSAWLGPGFKFLQRCWGSHDAATISFTMNVHGCLAELEWGGWKLVALPLVLRTTVKPEFMESQARNTLSFLASLKQAKMLGIADVDLVWREKIEKVSLVRIQAMTLDHGIDAVAELNDILTLSVFFSSQFSTIIVDLVNRTLDTTDAVIGGSRKSIGNPGWVLGACMQTLARRGPSEWAQKVDLAAWTRKCIDQWSWSTDVLTGLVALARISPPETMAIPFADVYSNLQYAIMSHSSSVRLNALRLLESNLVDMQDGPEEVMKRCLQGEEVALDIQGVRERVLRIGRVGQVVGDANGADLCARWLIAQLKINLRPLWSPASAALGLLSQRFGDLVWKLIFTELQVIGEGEGERGGQDANLHWMQEAGQNNTNSTEDPWEEERTWRDPSAHKIRSVVQERQDSDFSLKQLLKAQIQEERFDLMTYEFQILNTLGECSSLAEKHNRDLVPHFLSLVGPGVESKLPKQKLNAWLTLFAKFVNPKAMYSTETLRALHVSLLSHPDRSVQLLALSCLFTYKSPHLSMHEEKIRSLLDETRWRDELVTLDIPNIEPHDRAEVVDVIIRLLFGFMLERKGRTRGADRRSAVLSALAGCTDNELGLLVDLMLKPMGMNGTNRSHIPFVVTPLAPHVSDKQITGFLTLLGDVLKNIGPRLVQYWPSLLGMTIDLISNAQSRVDAAISHDDAELAEEELPVDFENDVPEVSSTKIIRSIRQVGLKRFADFFRSPVTFDYYPYMTSAYSAFITPRLSSLDRENTQAPSALMELFHVWTLESVHTHFLVEFNNQTLPKIYNCLVATHVKPSVISRIFDMVDRILAYSSIDERIRESVLKPHVSLLLSNLAILVERTKGLAAIATPLYQRQIAILSEIAQYSTDSVQASTLIGLFIPLLRKPAKFVPEKVKVDLIKIVGNLFSLIPDLSDRSAPIYKRTYTLLSQLLQSLRSRAARLSLVATFQLFASIDHPLQDLVNLLESLNAFSSKRMDEPDFDRRLEAFATLNEKLYKLISASDWLPILYNMLHFIQDPVELAIRNHAAFAMRHFIDLVAARSSQDYEDMFQNTLFVGLKNGLRSKNEMVRIEVLGVIAYAVEKCGHIHAMQEMQPLLEGGDEEANFFNNILHVQIHRRARSLRRLADHVDEKQLRSNTLAEIFIPLVENYVVSTSTIDHHLVNDAIIATGRMAKHLAWGPYYALVQKYLKLLKVKDESERVYIRTLVALLDNFHFPMDELIPEVETVEGVTVPEDADEVSSEGNELLAVVDTSAFKPRSGGGAARIVDAVNSRLLPNLLSHLETYDATTDDNTRIPISIGIVTVAQHLPVTIREPQITRLLTILSQIFRSKSQETRDLTRDALNRIALILGPTYLPLILRELRAALLRGPQLHVLAYVTHSLLVHVTSGEHVERFGTLDECVNDVAYVSAEAIFGQSGKDVQAEDFKTKMREVRSASSKGLDSFGIIAKFITPNKISSLLVPLRSIMHETESLQVMQQVEDVLARVAAGLNANKHLTATELLVLCHTLINQNAKFLKQQPQRKPAAKGDAIVQIKRQVTSQTDHYANNSFRFVAFGLDLFHTALKRNRLDFRDVDTMARLESMVAVVGNTLYSTSSPVLLIGLRCAADLAKAPLKVLPKSLPVFVRQILDLIIHAGNTESEVVQMGLKSLATILRDGPAVQVKEKDLVYLLELLSPDLEEPSRQASVFAMLRAIVARKFIVPEIYDVMEKVSEIMITSQSAQVQELCRGVLLQFLLDYPQGKGRLRNQMTFFARNLSYVYESGRKSVLELLGAVVSKFETTLIREYANLLFVALVMVIANDDSAKCREMAAYLIKTLYSRLDEERRNVILSHLHSWASQMAQSQLCWVSSQVYGFIIDTALADSAPYVSSIVDDLRAVLKQSAEVFSQHEVQDDETMDVDLVWQTPYHSLMTLSKILRIFPDFATQDTKIPWNDIISHLVFPHAWVRTASCRLIGQLFSTVPVSIPQNNLSDNHPLSTEGMQVVAMKLCQQLKSEHLDEALSLQITKNLFYLGKCFYLVPAPDAASIKTDVEGILDDRAISNYEKKKGHITGLNPLPWLFSKLSYQIRSAHIARRSKAATRTNWSQQPLAALHWFAAMSSHMEPSRLELFLVHILTPVYRLTEDDTIRDSKMDELKTTAVELQDLVQSKVGTTKFSNVYNRIRQSVLGVQRERKVARATQVTTNPEAAAKRKLQRNVIKKDSRKRKDRGFADGHGKIKRRRQD